MVTYELLKRIEQTDDFVFLLKKGIIPISVLDKKCYYEKYLQELKWNEKPTAITNTSIEFNVSERTIYNAIKFME